MTTREALDTMERFKDCLAGLYKQICREDKEGIQKNEELFKEAYDTLEQKLKSLRPMKFLSFVGVDDKRYVVRFDQIAVFTPTEEGLQIFLTNGMSIIVKTTFTQMTKYIDNNIGFI